MVKKIPGALASYSTLYLGGLPGFPKKKYNVELHVMNDRFVIASRIDPKWQDVHVQYGNINDVTLAPRTVSTFEGLLGGLDSRQLNQDNNIHIDYIDHDGSRLVVRFEMITGVSVMGQARVCREFSDLLMSRGIRQQFRSQQAAPTFSDVPTLSAAERIAKVDELLAAGLISAQEHSAKRQAIIESI